MMLYVSEKSTQTFLFFYFFKAASTNSLL